jgi:hypothetical protein
MPPMRDPADAMRQIDALAQLALRLAGTASSGRVAMSKLADSLQPEWMPRPWDQTIWPELVRAQQAAREPLSFRTVEDVLRGAWQAKPASELDQLEPEPAAVTATSQVHRGVREGKPVAVKVLKPGLASSVRQDLVLLDSLVAPLRNAFPGIDPVALLREARERVMDEFDLEHEAGMQRRFQRALRNHPFLVVPAPLTDLCREQVLVSEWIEGTSLRTPPPDPDSVAAQLLVFVLGGLREGLVHVDADLDDILVLDDGRLAVLDYGAVATPVGTRVDSTQAIVAAFRAGDAAALGSALGELGLLDPELGEVALTVSRHALGPLGEDAPALLDTGAVVAISERIEQVGADAVRLLLGGGLDPLDLWPGRAIAQVFSVIARIGATAAWPERVQSALSDGWQSAG